MEGSFQVPEQYPPEFVNWSGRGPPWFPQSNFAADNVPLLFVFQLAEHRFCSVTQDNALL
jgi:hypothetical protein